VRALAPLGGSMEVTGNSLRSHLPVGPVGQHPSRHGKAAVVSRKQRDRICGAVCGGLEPRDCGSISTHAPDSERIYAQIAERSVSGSRG